MHPKMTTRLVSVETRQSSYFCLNWVPSSYFVFMTSSLIFNLIGLATTQTQLNGSRGLVTYTINSNQTNACSPCPKSDSDGASAGVILGSAIAGAIVGGVVTAALMTYLRNRSQSPPPKDYDGRDEQVRLDVNRNDDVILTNGGDKDVEDHGPDSQVTKTHKKLERLVNRNPYQKPEMAAVPLIHNTDASSDVTSHGATTPIGKTQDQESSTVAGASPGKSKKPPARPPVEDSGYLNVGDKGRLEQPYDSLAMVPEEVEYENQKQHVYEAILSEKDTSDA